MWGRGDEHSQAGSIKTAGMAVLMSAVTFLRTVLADKSQATVVDRLPAGCPKSDETGLFLSAVEHESEWT
jgi:hypothetical protein